MNANERKQEGIVDWLDSFLIKMPRRSRHKKIPEFVNSRVLEFLSSYSRGEAASNHS